MNPKSIFTVSAKRLFDQNPFAYYFRYVLGYMRPREAQSIPILFGHDLHRAINQIQMAIFDKREAQLPPQPNQIISNYLDWYFNRGYQKIIVTEFPVLTRLIDLADFWGLSLPKELLNCQDELYYGGVIDAIVEENNNFWIKDYKTFRSYAKDQPNVLYDLDQLGMYLAAMKQLSKTPEKFVGFLLEKIYVPYSNPNTNTKTNTKTKEKTKNWKRKTKELGPGTLSHPPNPPSPSRRGSQFTAWDEQGRLIRDSFTFIVEKNKKRIGRIYRYYYNPTDVELRNTVKEFLDFVAKAKSLESCPYYVCHRYSGPQDEFYDLALAIRRGQEIDRLLADNYQSIVPNLEVLHAIEEWRNKSFFLDKARALGVEWGPAGPVQLEGGANR
jgi:hypothetical protein